MAGPPTSRPTACYDTGRGVFVPAGAVPTAPAREDLARGDDDKGQSFDTRSSTESTKAISPAVARSFIKFLMIATDLPGIHRQGASYAGRRNTIMLFQVLILVCSVALSHADCQPETALDVIQGPDARNELMCGFHGQAYLASTAVGTHLHEGEYVKVKCRRTGIGLSVG